MHRDHHASEFVARSDDSLPNSLSGGLGWFSLGLGLTELVAPRLITRALGMQGREGLVRSYGLREIAAGAGILATNGPSRAPWMWARVGGDLLDIATVARAPGHGELPKGRMGATLAMLAGVTLVDAWCASQLASGQARLPRQSEVNARRLSARTAHVRYSDGIETTRTTGTSSKGPLR